MGPRALAVARADLQWMSLEYGTRTDQICFPKKKNQAPGTLVSLRRGGKKKRAKQKNFNARQADARQREKDGEVLDE